MVKKKKQHKEEAMEQEKQDARASATEQETEVKGKSGEKKDNGENEKGYVTGDKKEDGKKAAPLDKESEYEAKIAELNDKFLRLYSEFDNYRRRTSKEKLDLARTASEELIVELLPVIDDFERAIRSSEDVQDCEAVKSGINLIYNKFLGILTKKGLAPIEAREQEFDTDFHEAITYIPAPSEEMKGKVVDEIEKGYKLNDKVIRYTKVVIGQ